MGQKVVVAGKITKTNGTVTGNKGVHTYPEPTKKTPAKKTK